MSNEKRTITIEDLQASLPSKKGVITQEAVDIINASMNEPEFQGETLLQTAITYQKALEGKRVGVQDYLYAIKFCAYLTSMKDNYTEAYARVFAERDFVKERVGAPKGTNKYNELSSAASRYRKSKLVVDILTYSQVPMHLLYRGYQYEAIDVLREKMLTAKLDRDAINAAKELLAATKAPENMKIELDVGVKESSAVQQLNDQLAAVASRQKAILESGAGNLQEFGAMKVKEDVIEGEVIDE